MIGEAKAQRLIDICLVTGALAGAAYAIAMFDLLPARASNLAFMAFGPLFVVAVFGMHASFRRQRDSAGNDIAHLLLVSSGLCFTLMATMQMSIYSAIPAYHRGALEPDAATWAAILRSVSSTQLGLDYAFDLFVSAGAAVLGWQMLRLPRPSRALGVAGLLIGVLGLAANTWTFPDNAGEAGLLDPAPFFGVWFGGVWLLVLRRRRPTENVG